MYHTPFCVAHPFFSLLSFFGVINAFGFDVMSKDLLKVLAFIIVVYLSHQSGCITYNIIITLKCRRIISCCYVIQSSSVPLFSNCFHTPAMCEKYHMSSVVWFIEIHIGSFFFFHAALGTCSTELNFNALLKAAFYKSKSTWQFIQFCNISTWKHLCFAAYGIWLSPDKIWKNKRKKKSLRVWLTIAVSNAPLQIWWMEKWVVIIHVSQ